MPSTRLSIAWWHWRRRVVTVLMLAASSYLAADLTTVIMGATIEASMPPSKPAGGHVAIPPPTADTAAILKGNLFNPNQRGGNPTAASAEQAPSPVAIQSTHLLVGTVTGGGDFGFAVLEEKTSHAQNLFRIGDLLPGGAQLMGIERYAVTIRVGTALQRLTVEEEVPTATTAASGPVVAPGGVREVAANHWLIERGKIDAALANLPKLLTQARLIPNFTGGKADGFRLLSMQPGSFYTEIGLQEGDVLQRINGIEVNDPQNLLKAFQQLQNESAINVDLQRRSQPVTLAYEIR
ncbi:MAG TPA: type II secretion system protein GspC [Nitrospiria bacterium]|nr:type II secretion system protein GspC [Nitrospiria bacterium]